MYGHENWTIKKAEHRGTDATEQQQPASRDKCSASRQERKAGRAGHGSAPAAWECAPLKEVFSDTKGTIHRALSVISGPVNREQDHHTRT